MNTRVESRGRNRIRGKKRIEIIQKFLEGEEDPKYEVVPTVTEGKYFVRPRKNESKKEKQGQGAELNEDQISEEEEEVEEPKQKQQKQKQQKLKPELKQEQKQKKLHSNETLYGSTRQRLDAVAKEPQDTTCPYDPTISYQILEQLKLLGEEQKLKREKKEQKKLVKHQIRKQLKQQKRKQESSDRRT